MVVFTAMLLANSAVYAAENTVLKTSVVSSAELREGSLGSLSVGLASFGSLAALQAVLQSTPMDCGSSQAYLGSLAGSISGRGGEGDIAYSYSSTWGYAEGSPGLPGDALLPGFSGYSPGELNVEVATLFSAAFAGGLPSYSTGSAEVLHYQVPVQRMVSECLSALSDLGRSLSSLHACTQRAVQGEVTSEDARYPGLVAEATATVSVLGSRCVVVYTVMITQRGIAGVSGTFQWSVSGSGSSSFGVSPPSGPPGT